MKKVLYGAAVLALVIAAALGGYAVGKNTAEPVFGTTFYASIDQINGSSLLVTGLEVNDINSRGQFRFQITDHTALEWRHTPIEPTQLKAGDRISVTYTGAVEETYPAGLEGVVRVQLLEDER